MTVMETAGPPAEPYLFGGDVPAHKEEQRHVLARILDEHSIGVLSGVGVAPGWRCLDVGAGAGTITAWLADRVGPDGQVVALDLDPCLIPPRDNVTVIQDDVRTVDLPDAHYDLIHVRLVLIFLPEREEVLKRLSAALKPGGTLVVSDWWARPPAGKILRVPSPAAGEAFEAFQRAVPAIMEANGADLDWAPRVPLAMAAVGLTGIRTVVHSQLWHGGEAGHLLHLHNSYLVRDALLARGLTADQLDLLHATLVDPHTLAYGLFLYTTTGSRG